MLKVGKEIGFESKISSEGDISVGKLTRRCALLSPAGHQKRNAEQFMFCKRFGGTKKTVLVKAFVSLRKSFRCRENPLLFQNIIVFIFFHLFFLVFFFVFLFPASNIRFSMENLVYSLLYLTLLYLTLSRNFFW